MLNVVVYGSRQIAIILCPMSYAVMCRSLFGFDPLRA